MGRGEQPEMPIKTLKSPLVASGPVVLRLLVTATIVLQHTGALTSEPWYLTCDDIKEEFCLTDPECYECIAYWDAPDDDALAECFGSFDNGMDADDTSETCRISPAASCCFDSYTSTDCLGNSAYVEVSTCEIYAFAVLGGYEDCLGATSWTCGDGRGGGAVADYTDDVVLLADDDTGYTDGLLVGAVDDDAVAGDDGEEPPAATAATATSSSSPCAAKYDACDDDAECNACFTGRPVVDGKDAAFTECLDNEGYGDAADFCSAASASPCCYDLLSINDCLGNSAFKDYWVCIINESSVAVGQGECTTVTCSDSSTSVEGSGTSGVGRSSPSVVLSAVSGVGYLAAAAFLLGVLL